MIGKIACTTLRYGRLLQNQEGEMPGLESLLGVWDVKSVKGKPREHEAKQLLEKISDQVSQHRQSLSAGITIRKIGLMLCTIAEIVGRPEL